MALRTFTVSIREQRPLHHITNTKTTTMLHQTVVEITEDARDSNVSLMLLRIVATTRTTTTTSIIGAISAVGIPTIGEKKKNDNNNSSSILCNINTTLINSSKQIKKEDDVGVGTGAMADPVAWILRIATTAT